MGDAESGPIRLSFNPQLRVEFQGATVTSDAGVLLPRELDERLRLDALIERHLTDPRTGHNRQFPLADLFRQSIYSRLAGAPQYGTDPARCDPILDPAGDPRHRQLREPGPRGARAVRERSLSPSTNGRLGS